jgi:hypothetical protein
VIYVAHSVFGIGSLTDLGRKYSFNDVFALAQIVVRAFPFYEIE